MKDEMNEIIQECQNILQPITDKASELGKIKINLSLNRVAILAKQLHAISNIESHVMSQTVFDYESLNVLSNVQIEYDKVLKSIGSGLITAVGIGGVGIFYGTASTGAAISTLSNAPFWSALFAWMGGGAKAAGGLGIAGGVLGTAFIVVGVASAAFSLFMSSKFNDKLNEARRYKVQLSNNINIISKEFFEISNKSIAVFNKFDTLFLELSIELSNSIGNQNYDYNNLSNQQKELVNKALYALKYYIQLSSKEMLKEEIFSKDIKIISRVSNEYIKALCDAEEFLSI
jgi:hypothetical protein